MNKSIDNIRKARLFLLDSLQDVTIEALNEVPAGFNNNIIWNLGHLIASQQGHCYKRSGLSELTDHDLFEAYKSGSRPNGFVDEAGVNNIKEQLLNTIDAFEEKYTQGAFKQYEPFETRYKISITNIDDAIDFVLFHEGLHSGYINALKRIVKQ